MNEENTDWEGGRWWNRNVWEKFLILMNGWFSDHRWFFIDHRFHRLAQIKSQRLGKIEKLMIDYWFILGTDGHGFEKGTAGCAMGKGYIC